MVVFHAVLPFVLAPLLAGLINKTKAVFAGRRGAPLLQPYYDLGKLLGKGAVYSATTTWIFRAGPLIGLAATVAACLVAPLGGRPGPLSFEGDVILFAYVLGLSRFFTVIAALDTGSSFEGMGASREVHFSTLVEPALWLGLAALVRITGQFSLHGVFSTLSPDVWTAHAPALALVATAFGIVFLAENARIPVDDPNTHLELTMIHEVMVLDHGGPDLALIEYASALRLWILGSLVVGPLLPQSGEGWEAVSFVAALAALAVATGVVESTLPRLRLLGVPKLLVGAGVMSSLALVLALV
ncbi:MAG: NADH-quinone oxidoreductase subunit H [Nitrospirae bacterium]|nr:NADH-quinone oxidoreductase subunit H [Nitrospirota bacterium]